MDGLIKKGLLEDATPRHLTPMAHVFVGEDSSDRPHILSSDTKRALVQVSDRTLLGDVKMISLETFVSTAEE